MKYINLINLKINIGSLQNFLYSIKVLCKNRQSSSVYVANVHMCIETWICSKFAKIINSSDITTPDGMPLIQSLKLLHHINQERVDGMSLFPEVLSLAEKEQYSVYFYGSTLHVLRRILKRATNEHPNLVIAGYHSPPFRDLSNEEEFDIINQINSSAANIVFVALGCPKQERWIASKKGKINAVMIGVGGAFPVYAGLQKRAPKWMREASLEWLFRLYQEPRRLFKRYFITNSIFLFLIAREIIIKKIFSARKPSFV